MSQVTQPRPYTIQLLYHCSPHPRLSAEQARGQELNQTFCYLFFFLKMVKALIQSSPPLCPQEAPGRDPLLSQKALRGGNLLTSTWQDPRPGCSSHNKLGLRQEVGGGGEMGGRWTGLSGQLPQQENWEGPRLSQQEGEAKGTAGSETEDV